MRVVSRTSSFQFGSVTMDSREIGRRLGVGVLLEGSIRKQGLRLRITADLIDVSNGYSLWTKRYDRETRDVFEIQDEIARSIADALKVQLSQQEKSAMLKGSTRHLEAYSFYLRGRQYFYQYKEKSMQYALQMFSKAIELDPRYARAYAGIADCCSFLYMYAGNREEEREKALSASERALELNPESAEAHASRGVALYLQGNYQEAELSFETAIQLDDTLFEAYYFYARTAFVQGELERAIELFEKAGQERADDYQCALLVAQIYDEMGREAEATATRRRGVRIVEELIAFNPDDSRALYMGGNGLVALGETEKGLEWARKALAIDPEEPMVLYNVACVYSLAGEADQALQCLETAVRSGLRQRGWLEHDSNLDLIREQPRFQALLDELK
jgi:tetratricopeptide (TPR) repeat protein